ncbi:MAG TPA: hypothetical protein VK699_14195 [Terriglobales bacterium]|nr:hypothetical protein [Terriglobales bacterium]
MKAKFLCLLGVLLLVSSVAFAGSQCQPGNPVATAGPTIVPADGRIVDFDFVAQSGGINYYETTLTAGHSYSIEVREDYDDVSGTPITVALYANNTCSGSALAAGSATTGYRDTSGIDPALPLNSFRGSVIPPASGPYSIKVTNSDAIGHYISVSVQETTLYSAFWSDDGGNGHTFWVFTNTTTAAVTGTLTLTTGGNTPQTFTKPVAMVASGAVGLVTTSISGVAGQGGNARFAHDGPGAAVIVRTTVANFATGYLEPVPFASLKDKR